MATPRTPWEGAPREPRRWQRESLDAVRADFAKGEKPLIVAATGTGKATLLAELAWLALAKCGDKAIIVSTPSENLVGQLADTIRLRCGAAAVGEYFGRRKQADRRIVVCCNPSLGKLALEVAARGCHILAVDEAHKSETDVIQQALPALRPRALLGCTATPYRTDSKSLGLFTKVSYRYLMRDATRDGVLVPYTTIRPTNEDLGDVRDVDLVSLQMIRNHGEGPGIVSARNIPEAESYAAFLTEHGVKAEAIHSKLSPGDQKARRARLLAGDIRCLVHVAMLVEGVDIPALRWLCLRRPTASIVRLVQEVGRVLRISPETGKTRAFVLDPYMLIDNITLDHGETVGAGALDDALEAEVAAGEPREEGDGSPIIAKPLPPVIAISAMRAWTRSCIMALVEADIAKEPIQPSAWRAGWATQAQLNAMDRLKWATRHLPKDIREAVKFTLTLREDLHAGEASDLIGLLSALADGAKEQVEAGHGWGWKPDCEWPPIPTGAIASLQARVNGTGGLFEPEVSCYRPR